MAMPVGFIVGPQTYSDGTPNVTPSVDRAGAGRVIQTNGRFAEACRLGQMFTYCTPAAGVQIPIFSNTTQQCVLFNPVGNTKALWIKRIVIGYVSGTMVAGHYALATQTLATNAITGTQSSIVQPHKLVGNVNANGQNGQSGQLFTAATVVAFSYLRPMIISQVAQTAAGTNAPWVSAEDVDGSLLLMPGAAIAVCANAAAFVTAAVAIEVVEAPLALAV